MNSETVALIEQDVQTVVPTDLQFPTASANTLLPPIQTLAIACPPAAYWDQRFDAHQSDRLGRYGY